MTLCRQMGFLKQAECEELQEENSCDEHPELCDE